MARSFGLITPNEFGRWQWPFAHMQAGDSFKVAPNDRPKGAIVSLTHNRASQLGKRFRTGSDQDGNTVVTCIDPALPFDQGEHVLAWEHGRRFLASVYGDAVIDAVPWELVEDGQRRHMMAQAAQLPSNTIVRLWVGKRAYKVEMAQDRLWIEPLTSLPSAQEIKAVYSLLD